MPARSRCDTSSLVGDHGAVPGPTILDADVRADLAAAHAATIVDLGRAGDWLSADEKVALATTVRAARAAVDDAPWFRPSEAGMTVDPLPPAAVDAAWRITNQPGTLTHDWYRATVEGLPSPGYYVELVAVVAAVNAVDRLADILDLALIPLPEPAPGAPHRPIVDTRVSSHWVPTAVDARGPNVLRALSAVPAAHEIRARLLDAQYLPTAALLGDLDWSRGTLDRRQIELVAALTSLHNECFY